MKKLIIVAMLMACPVTVSAEEVIITEAQAVELASIATSGFYPAGGRFPEMMELYACVHHALVGKSLDTEDYLEEFSKIVSDNCENLFPPEGVEI